MARYLPILLGVVLIVGLTIPQIRMTDRFSGTSLSDKQQEELPKFVPKDFGDWHGEDKPVDAGVRKTAGAIGAVSREYRNARTGERVDLWLIVGHSREVSFHTPDVCYPSSGFQSRAKENSLYPLVVQGMPETPFWTNTFLKEDALSGQHLVRVFWSWYNPESQDNQGKVVWEAPQNPRMRFGNSRALYKMYFTSQMRDYMETAEQSACLHFARDFLPEVDKALSEVHHKTQSDEAAKPGAEQPPLTPAAEPAIETPKADVAAAEKSPAVSAGDTAPPANLAPATDGDGKKDPIFEITPQPAK